MSELIKDIIDELEMLKGDSSTPKNVKEKVNEIIEILKDKSDKSMQVNKALHELDNIADDINLQPYTRTQIWNIVSLLEKI
jgi:uncharacterized protein (UPF0147 family)